MSKMKKLLPPAEEDTATLYNKYIAAGYPDLTNGVKGVVTVTTKIAKMMDAHPSTVKTRLTKLEDRGVITRVKMTPQEWRESGGKPNRPSEFSVQSPGPHIDKEEWLEDIKQRRRKEHQRQPDLTAYTPHKVKINLEGPIAIAMIGDPHVDDPQTDFSALEKDVEIIQQTKGMLAIAVGDYRNNWVGRLAKIHAEQTTTTDETLMLIEWLFGSIDWLVLQKGNHDEWNADGGDTGRYVRDMLAQQAIYQGGSTRLELQMPCGSNPRIHVRHDFPGTSQFNAAHGHVRQTLYGFRDHILVCGDRHHAGYIPIWHLDPEKRLCHGFRVGAYKNYDHYAADKGFKPENWARSMAAVIDPRYKDEPERFIKPFFNLEDAAEYLNFIRKPFDSES